MVRACINYCCVLQQPAFYSLYRGFSCYHNFSGVFLVEFFPIICLQRLPISFKTHSKLLISEIVNWTSKHASFLGLYYYNKIEIPQHLLSCLIVFFLILFQTVIENSRTVWRRIRRYGSFFFSWEFKV